MKKILLATASLVVLTGSAMAADMPIKARPIVAAAPVCAQFGGFYLGGHIGWKYYKHDWKDKDNFGFDIYNIDHVGDGTESDSSWHAGAQVGYNLQWGCTVWGFQADWSWTDVNAGNDWTDAPVANQQTLNYSSNEKWFGTLRTKTGVVVDNLLLYVTGGLAYANFDRNFLYNAPAVANSALAFSSSDTKWGWVVGVGTEWALNQNWSIVSEVLYMGFERDGSTFTCTNANVCGGNRFGAGYRYDFDDEQWAVRIGVNYRFGGYAPIVAKY